KSLSEKKGIWMVLFSFICLELSIEPGSAGSVSLVFVSVFMFLTGSAAIHGETNQLSWGFLLTKPLSREGFIILKISADLFLWTGVIVLGEIAAATLLGRVGDVFSNCGVLLREYNQGIYAYSIGLLIALWRPWRAGWFKALMILAACILALFFTSILGLFGGVPVFIKFALWYAAVLGACFGFIIEFEFKR